MSSRILSGRFLNCSLISLSKPEAAESAYGVVLTRHGRRYELDAAATARMRRAAPNANDTQEDEQRQ